METMDLHKLLDRYILDYMVKKNMTEAAEIFSKEADVSKERVAIDEPHSFLSEWWEILWTKHCISAMRNPEAKEGSPVKDTQMMECMQQYGQTQDTQTMGSMQQYACPPVPKFDANQVAMQSSVSRDSKKKKGLSAISLLAKKIYGVDHATLFPDLNPNLWHYDVDEYALSMPLPSYMSQIDEQISKNVQQRIVMDVDQTGIDDAHRRI